MHIVKEMSLTNKEYGDLKGLYALVYSEKINIDLIDEIVDAIQILETLGLEYEFVEEYSEDVSVGLVSHTLPAAGEIVTPDEIISVIVSLGIKIEVPEVEGLGYEAALDILEEAGLVAAVSGDTNGKIQRVAPA